MRQDSICKPKCAVVFGKSVSISLAILKELRALLIGLPLFRLFISVTGTCFLPLPHWGSGWVAVFARHGISLHLGATCNWWQPTSQSQKLFLMV